MKRSRLVEKTFALAELSEQAINRLRKLGLDVSEFVASMASLFSSVFGALTRAVEDTLQFSRRLGDFALTRVRLPPPGFWFRRAAPTVEEYLTPKMGAANVTFLFNVTLARRAAAEFTRRAAVQIPQLALPGIKTAEAVAGVSTDLQRLSEAALTPHVGGAASAFQEYTRRIVLPAPPLAMLKPPLMVTEREPPLTIPVTALAAMPIVQLKTETVRSVRIASELPSLALGFQAGLPPRPSTVAPKISLPPVAEAEAKPALPSLPPPGVWLSPGVLPSLAMRMALPPVSMPTFQLKPEIAESVGIATGLPSLALEPWAPILKRIVALLAVSPIPLSAALKPLLTTPVVGPPLIPPVAALAGKEKPQPSLLQGPLVTMPLVELKPEGVRPLTLGYVEPLFDYLRYIAPLRYPSQIDRVSEEILSSLTLWSHRIPWVLGTTALTPPAVSIGASAAQALAAQAFAQPPSTPLFKKLPGPVSVVPTSGFETARALAVQAGTVLAGLGRFGMETDVWRIPAGAPMLPPTVAPFVAQPSQLYPTVSVVLEAITRFAQAVPEKAPSLGEVPGLGELFREATFNLLAKSVVARSFTWPQIASSLGGIISLAFRYAPLGEMQTIRLSYGEALAGLGGFAAMRETMIGRLPLAGYGAFRAVELPMPRIPPSRPTPPTAPRLPGPTIQNTFNVTISADSEEELRNLERKIARILAEQIRRYYGSVGI